MVASWSSRVSYKHLVMHRLQLFQRRCNFAASGDSWGSRRGGHRFLSRLGSKLGPTGHVVWLKFGGRVRIIFASWVNFNRAIISKQQLSVDDGLQIQKNQHIKHDFLSELFSNEDTKKVGRHLRHSWHVFHLYFLGGFETRIRKSKYSVRHRHARPEFWYLFCLLFSLH